MDVEIDELGRRLGEFLDLAERGERITLMERGRPKAMLGPCPALPGAGVENGWLTPGSGRPLRPITRVRGLSSIDSVLSSDRDG